MTRALPIAGFAWKWWTRVAERAAVGNVSLASMRSIGNAVSGARGRHS
jgi:hypothetical protein